ncbi:hypothetical protein D917_06534 [Trichinella nativa]|uniref:Uncharacterized protein n=1 Tax=Trichinella nativa TaxID=6335 RepID=A0A1Y3ET55_9BILA|nr:hypothetical protein D917_06534 [Trichinella nativa]
MNVSRILLKKYNVPTYRSLSFIRYNACRGSGKHFQKSLNSADFMFLSLLLTFRLLFPTNLFGKCKL